MAEILVVGAGPTGLTLACELYRRGVPCRVVDRRAVHIDRSRAVDVQPRTLHVFDQLGIADQVLAEGQILTGMGIYDSPVRLARLALDSADARFPHACALPQTRTETLLEERLRALGGTVERGVRLSSLDFDGDGVWARLVSGPDHQELTRFAWVVGCDGAASTVRQTAEIDFEERGHAASFVTADADLDLALPRDELSLFLSSDGFLMLLPLPGRRRYRVLADTSNPADRPDSPDALMACVSRHVGSDVYLHEVSLVATYHVQRRLARQFRRGRVLLAGDAAHTFNPIGGHGMNQGVQDAHNLGWKLALVARGDSPADLLSSYESERRNAARVFTREMDFSARLRLSRMATESDQYDRLMDFAVVAPPLRRIVLDSAMIPHWMYQSGLFVRDVVASGFDRPDAVHAGSLAPDIAYNDDGERTAGLLDGVQHTLLLFSGERDRAHAVPKSVLDLAEKVGEHWRSLVHVVVVIAGAGSINGWGGATVRDTDGRLHVGFGAQLPCAYLVRPDGHVGFRCLPLAAGPLLEHLDSLFPRDFASLG